MVAVFLSLSVDRFLSLMPFAVLSQAYKINLKNTKNMKELKTPISFLLYSVGAYIVHMVILDLVVMVERVIYHGQVGL